MLWRRSGSGRTSCQSESVRDGPDGLLGPSIVFAARPGPSGQPRRSSPPDNRVLHYHAAGPHDCPEQYARDKIAPGSPMLAVSDASESVGRYGQPWMVSTQILWIVSESTTTMADMASMALAHTRVEQPARMAHAGDQAPHQGCRHIPERRAGHARRRFGPSTAARYVELGPRHVSFTASKRVAPTLLDTSDGTLFF